MKTKIITMYTSIIILAGCGTEPKEPVETLQYKPTNWQEEQISIGPIMESPPLQVVVLGDLSASTNLETPLNIQRHFSPLIHHVKDHGGRVAYGKIGDFKDVAPPFTKAIISSPPQGRPDPVPDSIQYLERSSLQKAYEEKLATYQISYQEWLKNETQPEIDRFYSALLVELNASDKIHSESNVVAAMRRSAIFLSAPETEKSSKYILVCSDLENTTDELFDNSLLPKDVEIICVYGKVNREQAEKLGIEIIHYMESVDEAIQYILNNEKEKSNH